jgi:hypothetical protein
MEILRTVIILLVHFLKMIVLYFWSPNGGDFWSPNGGDFWSPNGGDFWSPNGVIIADPSGRAV